jgi:hypothetical protein
MLVKRMCQFLENISANFQYDFSQVHNLKNYIDPL